MNWFKYSSAPNPRSRRARRTGKNHNIYAFAAIMLSIMVTPCGARPSIIGMFRMFVAS